MPAVRSEIDLTPPQQAAAPMLLETRGLSRAFKLPGFEGKAGGELTAVDSVDFVAPRGAIVAIFGESGSGKTSLLRMLGGLDRPDTGQLWFDGREMTAASRGAWTKIRRREIGYVFQRFLLHGHRTAVENVVLPLLLNGFSVEESRESARNALESVGLARRADEVCSRLSGGQCQRVALARALAVGPRLLLADEPTGNLDAGTAAEMLKLLLALREQHGLTIVVTTHDELVGDAADEVWTMKAGRLNLDARR